MKKRTSFILCAISAVLAAVALVAYIVNTQTAYFAKDGVNAVVIGCSIASLCCALIAMFADGKLPAILTDAAVVAVPVTAMVAFMNLINDRTVGIAAVMTFENNASNMADLTSCLVALGAALITVIVGIISGFVGSKK